MAEAAGAFPSDQAPEIPGMLPVPVILDRAVEVRERQPRSWSTQQIPVPKYPEQTRILGKNLARKAAMLTPAGSGIYIAPDQQSCTPSTGFPINNAGNVSISHTDEVWACTDPGVGTAGAIAVLAQYVDG